MKRSKPGEPMMLAEFVALTWRDIKLKVAGGALILVETGEPTRGTPAVPGRGAARHPPVFDRRAAAGERSAAGGVMAHYPSRAVTRPVPTRRPFTTTW
jgi:hypothetical protein